MNRFLIPTMLVLLGAGCSGTPVPEHQGLSDLMRERLAGESIVFPIEGYVERRTDRAFGEEIHDGRFNGLHVADDIEVPDNNREYPVVAIADGEVTHAKFISGYGGMIRVRHEIEGEIITAIYGHVDVGNMDVSVGEKVEKGQFLANLGDHESSETDGERKHLHFGLYEGGENRIQGYEQTERGALTWLNPTNVFERFGQDALPNARMYPGQGDVGTSAFPITFMVPEGMEVEYVPSIQALNVYALDGEGLARDRSQVFIRYFDASDFLTLSTVTIHSTADVLVGSERYVARRYDIEKKSGVRDFVDQPDWRNDRHMVTDFRLTDGFARYFVVAVNPEADPGVANAVLASMKILK